MHVEVPKPKFSSLREFAAEYLMIVISIGTALALEHAVQSWHHRHLAEEARQRMDVEIQQNTQQIIKDLEHNKTEMQALAKLHAGLLHDIKAKVPDAQAIAHLTSLTKGNLGFSLNSPTTSHDAWDVAVANQSASWLEPAELQRYSRTYALFRDMAAVTTMSVSMFNGAQMMKTASDLQMGTAKPGEVLFTITSMQGSYAVVINELSRMSKELEAAKAAAHHRDA